MMMENFASLAKEGVRMMAFLRDAMGSRWWVGGALLGCLLAIPAAWAQGMSSFDQTSAAAASRTACASFQGRKLSLIVSNKPGGGFDLMARTFGPFLEQHSGMSVAVSNVTGAQGMMAIRAVADARSDRPVVGLMGPGPLVNQYVTQASALDWSRLSALGLMSTEYAVWLARQPQSWLEVGTRRYLVTSSASPSTMLGVPAHLLGLNFQPVLGYEGTSEAWLALLRGEIDVMTTSDQSARRTLAAGRQAVVSLTLTQTPHPDFPGVPHLAGRGGLVDLRTRDMAPARRKQLMEQAALAVTLSEQARMLLVSAKLPAPLQACLRHASEAALFDPAFAEAAKRQKLVLEPEPAGRAQARMAVLQQLLEQHKEFLRSIAKAWTGAH